MIRIAIGYVAVVVACALLILVNPMDFMGKAARQERLAAGVAEKARTIPTSEPADQVASDQASGSIAATTAAILADLTAAAEAGGQTPAAPETAENAALRKMSEAVIAGLKGTPAATPQSLEMLVAQALAEGQTEKAIDEIVNAAVAEGAVAAPEGLTTTEGKVDTAVLLAAIEAEAQGDDRRRVGHGRRLLQQDRVPHAGDLQDGHGITPSSAFQMGAENRLDSSPAHDIAPPSPDRPLPGTVFCRPEWSGRRPR